MALPPGSIMASAPGGSKPPCLKSVSHFVSASFPMAPLTTETPPMILLENSLNCIIFPLNVTIPNDLMMIPKPLKARNRRDNRSLIFDSHSPPFDRNTKEETTIVVEIMLTFRKAGSQKHSFLSTNHHCHFSLVDGPNLSLQKA
jgi:hypothetical protein